MKEGIVGGEAFAVDASMIVADAHRRRGAAKVKDLDRRLDRKSRPRRRRCSLSLAAQAPERKSMTSSIPADVRSAMRENHGRIDAAN